MKKGILAILMLFIVSSFVYAALPHQNNPILTSVGLTTDNDGDLYWNESYYVYTNYTYDSATYTGVGWVVNHGIYDVYIAPLQATCYDTESIIQLRMYSNYTESASFGASWGDCYNGTAWLRTTLNSISTSDNTSTLTAGDYQWTYDNDWNTYSLFRAENTPGWYITANGSLTAAYASWYEESLILVYLEGNQTEDYLRCVSVNESDADGDDIKRVYDWNNSGTELGILLMPFDGNRSHLYDYSTGNATVYAYNTDPWNKTLGISLGALDMKGLLSSPGSYDGDAVVVNFTQYDGSAWDESANQDFSVVFFIKYDDPECTPCRNDVTDCTALTTECECIAAYDYGTGFCLWNSTGACELNETDICTNGNETRVIETLFTRGNTNDSANVWNWGMTLGAENGSIRFHNVNTGFYIITDPDTVSYGEWYSIVLTRENRETKIYVRGTLKASGTDTGDLRIDNNKLILSSTYQQYYYYGLIDEFNIYGDALSANAIGFAYMLGAYGYGTLYPDMTAVGDEWQCGITLIDNDDGTTGDEVVTTRKWSGVLTILGLTPEQTTAASCRNTQNTIYAAFGLIALMALVGAAFAIISIFNGGNLSTDSLMSVVIGIIALGIVVMAGFVIISQVGGTICVPV